MDSCYQDFIAFRGLRLKCAVGVASRKNTLLDNDAAVVIAEFHALKSSSWLSLDMISRNES